MITRPERRRGVPTDTATIDIHDIRALTATGPVPLPPIPSAAPGPAPQDGDASTR